MQKKRLPQWGWQPPALLTKALMLMKLTAVFMLCACLQVSANVFSQEAKVTMKLKQVSIQELFKAIEKKTAYRFVFSNDVIPENVNVSVEVKETPVSEVLSHALNNTGLDFRMMVDGLIVVADRNNIKNFVAISGKVVDINGEPLEGVSVTIKGSSGGALTNAQGAFKINADPAAALVFSYVGFETQTIELNGRTNLTVTLKGIRELEVVTVVNTGYQVLDKERATGSFSHVDKEQLERPSTNISQRLIGMISGMQATLNVNGDPSFEIRGKTSLGTGASPLVVVDGFPIQGDFSTINPNNVESVTVLKDAAAASIWGSRSANGVIVVTTKSAKRGVPLKVEASAFTRVGAKFDLDYVNPLASSAETVDYEMASFGKWSAQNNVGAITNAGWAWSLGSTAMNEHALGIITLQERDAILAKLKTQSNKQQIKDLLLANPVNQQYNINLFGSSGRMSNALSLLYETNQSNFKETSDKRYMLNFRTVTNLTKFLDFTAGGMVQYTDASNNGVSLSDIQGISPYEMLVNEDGSLTDIHRYYTPVMDRFVPMSRFPYADWTYNPIQEIANRKFTTQQLNVRLQGGITIKLIKGLSIDSKVQYELFNTYNKNINNENTFAVRSTVNQATTWVPTSGLNGALTPNLPKGGMLTQNRSKGESYNFRNQVNFNRSFGSDHELNVVAGTEIRNLVTESFTHPTTYGYNDATLSVGVFPNGPGGTFKTIQNWMNNNQTFAYTNSFSYRTDRFFSYFGNAAYTYNSKYTLSASYRTDASNMISDDPKYRYAPFWSIGGSWQLHKESFFDVAFVNRLNIRLTYGFNGNEDRSTAVMPLISAGGTPNIYTNDYTATISSFGNPTLRWEKTGTWNLGIDYSLFANKLFGNLNIYNKDGRDLLATLSIPAVNGTTSQRLNNAEMNNKGIELEVGTRLPLKGNNISWQGSLNFSYNRNRITNLFVANYAASTLYSGGSGSYVEGYDANSVWRFRYAGIENNQPMVYGPIDKDGNQTKYDFGAFTPGDGRTYLNNMGTTVAPYTLGFMNTFRVYDFSLSFILTGKFGHVFQRKGFNYPPTWTSRVLPNVKLSEVVNGDPAQIVPLPLNDIEPRYYFWDRFHQYLSYLMEDASHIRMQEVNITYNLNKALLSRTAISRAQVFVQGNDLFTWYANNAKEDPEYLLGTMNPRPKFTFGVKLEL